MKLEILSALRFYALDHKPIGGFLRACLENDLTGAITRADDQNLKDLRDIAIYMAWDMPRESWGSKKIVEEWLGVEKETPF